MGFKKHKWYNAYKTKPDVSSGLIIQTDMGYIFEAIYKDGKYLVSTVKDGKVYFEESTYQCDIWRWMKI